MRSLCFCLLCSIASLGVAAQNADLVISNISFPAGAYNKGDRIAFSFTVKNTGLGNAGKSHTKLFLSSSFSYTGAAALATVSCKPLSAGEESADIKCAVVLPYTLTAGAKYLLLKADANNEVTEANETNDFHSVGTITIGSGTTVLQNLPYPIIFVHGFTSSNATWDQLKTDLQNNYGFSYGGNMNFCLNQDNNLATSNAATDYKDWTNVAALAPADFYTVNFDTDPNGNTITNSSVSSALESNQAGILKQGLAIRDAIKHVLQVTGKTKVILCGHSMGGLSGREYLQRPAIWQADGQHHVAKLVTLGTPHGGSNLTGAGLGSLGGLDEYSEAVRDFRTSYFWSGEPGVYLFGGHELYSVMTFYPFYNYWNADVNCNGVDADNSNIVGINSKPIPADIAYSCMIGNASGSGDYVVGMSSADLNNYRTVNADTFLVNAIHTSLTSQTPVIVKALDETKNPATALGILPNQFYSGLFTQQSVTAPTAADSDYYQFTMPQAGYIRIEVNNIPVQNAVVKIFDATNVLKYSSATNGLGYSDNTSTVLPAGNYFLNIAGVPEAGSDATPYSLKLNFLQVVPLSLLNFDAAPADKKVLLSWNTANETGITNYSLQRSADGSAWTELASVNTRNGGNNSYNSIDSFPLKENYYHLKINDVNGGFTYSAVKKVSFAANADLSFSISPNPAIDLAVLKFNASLTNAFIIVSDMQGKEIFKTKISGQEYRLDTRNFVAGVYAVRVINGEGSFTEKMMIRK